jgi:hypothetical protein
MLTVFKINEGIHSPWPPPRKEVRADTVAHRRETERQFALAAQVQQRSRSKVTRPAPA